MDLNRKTTAQMDERSALAAWSGIAEPADFRIGTLINSVGAVKALEWASRTYESPKVEQVDSTPWSVVHERAHLRYQQIDLEDELRRIARIAGRVVVRGDDQWPEALNDLGVGAPYALWVKGRLPRAQQRTLSIVGARASTAYGNAVATDFAFDLAAGGVSVISGGAYGIDAAAHRGAISGAPEAEDAATKGCPTVAVLCGGLDNLYPAGNSTLFKQILAKGGGLVSEMPPSYRPARWRFLERNRIIAVLGEASIVVEASPRSGAIGTANRAIELGREVAAVPGPITSVTSAGTNQLIADGALLVGSVSDALQLIGMDSVNDACAQFQRSLFTQPSAAQERKRLAHADPLERRAWEALPRNGAITAQSAATESGLSVSEIGRGLLGLQALGLANRNAAGRWSRV